MKAKGKDIKARMKKTRLAFTAFNIPLIIKIWVPQDSAQKVGY